MKQAATPPLLWRSVPARIEEFTCFHIAFGVDLETKNFYRAKGITAGLSRACTAVGGAAYGLNFRRDAKTIKNNTCPSLFGSKCIDEVTEVDE